MNIIYVCMLYGNDQKYPRKKGGIDKAGNTRDDEKGRHRERKRERKMQDIASLVIMCNNSEGVCYI